MQLQSVNRLLAEKGATVDLIFRVRLLRSLLGESSKLYISSEPIQMRANSPS
jgi:hypothetical protein